MYIPWPTKTLKIRGAPKPDVRETRGFAVMLSSHFIKVVCKDFILIPVFPHDFMFMCMCVCM